MLIVDSPHLANLCNPSSILVAMFPISYGIITLDIQRYPISQFNLFLLLTNKVEKHVNSACQSGKSSELSFPGSTSIFYKPLELTLL